MKLFFEEFKTFAIKGNVMELAVAVVIGTAFGKIVTSLVDNIIMPLVGLLLGGVNFSTLSVTVGDVVFMYGAFIQTVVDFIIVAFVVFLIVKAMNEIMSKEEDDKKEKAKKPSEEVVLLTEIRDSLKK